MDCSWLMGCPRHMDCPWFMKCFWPEDFTWLTDCSWHNVLVRELFLVYGSVRKVLFLAHGLSHGLLLAHELLLDHRLSLATNLLLDFGLLLAQELLLGCFWLVEWS